MKYALLTILFLTGTACSSKHPVDPSGINIEEIPVKVDFNRSYSGEYKGFNIKVTSDYDSDYEILGRRYSGILTQPGGKSIYFSPEEIAEKIIDRELIPWVEDFTTRAIAVDKQYSALDHKEFKDLHGNIWRRQ